MSHPGTRITVDAAMRARDVSRPQPEAPADQPQPGAKPRKGERRRLGKRAAARRTLGQEGSGGS